MLSCPPYWNLEVYSDDPADLSAMGREAFFAAYAEIIAGAVGRLREDRFAVWVIGDVRDAKGFFVNLPGRTVEAFEAAGARFYNDAILATAVGSLPIRAGRQFEASRKLGRTHQNVLVFCKGDPKRATAACGPVEFGEIADEADRRRGATRMTAPIVESHRGVLVVRDDLHPGGTKARFIGRVFDGARRGGLRHAGGGRRADGARPCRAGAGQAGHDLRGAAGQTASRGRWKRRASARRWSPCRPAICRWFEAGRRNTAETPARR